MSSQSCLPEGITFTTQSQIDSFQLNYPNCTEIEGFVRIIDDNIFDLNSLNVLTSVGGDLVVSETILTSLSGLYNISIVEGSVWIHANDSLPNLDGLNSLSYIGGSLKVKYNNSPLLSLDGLDNLASIGEDLDIYDNYLQSLNGLDSVETIGGSLIVTHTDELTNFQGLGNVSTIGGSVIIDMNYELINFSGLNNLNTIANWLVVENNSSLTNFDGLESLSSIGGNVYIEHNDLMISLSGLENLGYVGGDFEIKNIPSLHSLLGLDSLTDVGAELNIWYCPELKRLTGLNNLKTVGSLDIYFCPMISDLTALSTLERCRGGLRLGVIDSLDNLSGFSNLVSIGQTGWLEISSIPRLHDLSGLENLDTLGGLHIIGIDSLENLSGLEFISSSLSTLWIGWNNKLTDISTLSVLTRVEFDLTIESNEELRNLSGLHNIDSVGLLIIDNNDRLSSLEQLSNLSTLDGWIDIIDNDSLTSLSGLDNIDAFSIHDLGIRHNRFLTTCEVNSICDYLLIPGGYVEIHDNAPGCNSQVEVEEACTVGIPEQLSTTQLSAYPNPFTTSTTLEYEMTEPSSVQITIYNTIGEPILLADEGRLLPGKHTYVWTPERLPEGLYYAVLGSKEGVSVVKMVKQNY